MSCVEVHIDWSMYHKGPIYVYYRPHRSYSSSLYAGRDWSFLICSLRSRSAGPNLIQVSHLCLLLPTRVHLSTNFWMTRPRHQELIILFLSSMRQPRTHVSINSCQASVGPLDDFSMIPHACAILAFLIVQGPRKHGIHCRQPSKQTQLCSVSARFVPTHFI